MSSTSGIDISSLLQALTGASTPGINVSSVVSGAVYSMRARERQWQTQQNTLDTQSSSLSDLKSSVSNLSSIVDSLADSVGILRSQAITSSQSNIVSGAATTSAVAGKHVVKVANLAQTASWYSGSVASSTTPLSAGTFDVVKDGVTTTITVGSGVNTLDQLASDINGRNLGVTASVINDSKGSRLALLSNSSGDEGDFTVGNITGTNALGFSQAVQGKDASVTLDGIPVHSATNTISGALTGVTLNLNSAAPDTEVTLTIGPDTTSIESKINSFVTSYNGIISGLNKQFTYSATSESAGTLSGDTAARMLQNDLLNATSFQNQDSTVSTLRSLGITMSDDGTLTVDDTKLNDAVTNNLSAVQSFFQGTGSNGFANSLGARLDAYTDPTDGAFTVELKSFEDQKTDLQKSIDDFELYVADYQTRMTAQLSKAAAALLQMPQQQEQLNAQLGLNNKG